MDAEIDAALSEMEALKSRRQVLRAGGALGALGLAGAAGAMSGCAPTSSPGNPWAGPVWSWPSEATMPTTPSSGQDPTWVWDPEADELVGALLERGDVPDVNQRLRGWLKNSQALPDGLPPEVVAFIERARQLPSWVNQDRLNQASRLNTKRGLYLGVTYGFASGMMSTVIPHEARAVFYSKGGADMQDRITKTAKLGYDVGSNGAFGPGGEMIVTCVKTRLAHAGVRNLLPDSPVWLNGATEPGRIPISQQDMLVTWHSLPTTVMTQLSKWNVPLDRNETLGFLHSWQLTAHFLGIRDEYIPVSWAAARQQSSQMLNPVLAPTPEGINLAGQLVNLGSMIDGGLITRPVLSALTRFVLGDRIADWLRLPRDAFWDTALNIAWGPFIAVREGLLGFTGAPPILTDVYSTFDEILRIGALWYLSGGQFPISIQIPTTNNPEV